MESPILTFQKANCLVADNILGPKTLKVLMNSLRISSKQRMAHFTGQCSHESGNFSATHENLYYTNERTLPLIFRSPFDLDRDRRIDPEEIEFAKRYIKQPVKLANYVYANRMGNGNEQSGDGWKFRGRGPLQLTGKNNYVKFSKFIGEDCVDNPDLVATKYYFESALWYFNENRLWAICDRGVDKKTITAISKAVNLGSSTAKGTPHKLHERIENTIKYWNLIK